MRNRSDFLLYAQLEKSYLAAKAVEIPQLELIGGQVALWRDGFSLLF